MAPKMAPTSNSLPSPKMALIAVVLVAAAATTSVIGQGFYHRDGGPQFPAGRDHSSVFRDAALRSAPPRSATLRSSAFRDPAYSQYPYKRQSAVSTARRRHFDQVSSVKMKIPGATSESENQYFCTMRPLASEEQFLTDVTPTANSAAAHHVTLFGCEYASIETQPDPLEYWDCGGIFATCGGSSKILYSWSPRAEKLRLPTGVGFRLGAKNKINFLVLQVHYDAAFSTPDFSGVTMKLTRTPQPRVAGFYLLYSTGATIEAESRNSHVDVACLFRGRTPLRPFAFRVHTHDLGVAVAAYRIRDGIWTQLGLGDPRQPQSFFPIKDAVDVRAGDYLAARCTYDNPGDVDVRIGNRVGDEMCNFYLMYAEDANAENRLRGDGGGVEEDVEQCHTPADDHFVANFPHDADVVSRVAAPPSPNADAAHAAAESNDADSSDAVAAATAAPLSNLPAPQPSFVENISLAGMGQVGGLATDSAGRLVVFHRGSRRWGAETFSFSDRFNPRLGPIADNTLALIDTASGRRPRVLQEWGKDLFYLPHGLTIDGRGRLWVTDVGAHQVYRFSEMGNSTADLTLGVKMIPGNDRRHFCKPTDVAVMTDGTFFVADGYCNSRVIRFHADGNFHAQWGQSPAGSGPQPPPLAFFVPHGLAIAEELGLLCVADRENGRIQCTDLKGNFKHSIQSNVFKRLFAVEYSPADKVLFAVNGPDMTDHSRVLGFTISLKEFRILNTWNRNGKDFDQPHDVTVSPDGKFVFVGEIGPDRVTAFHVVDVVPSGLDSVAAASGASGLSLAVSSSSSAVSSASSSSSFLVSAFVIIVGVLVIVIGASLIGRQRFAGLTLRQAAKVGFDRVRAVAASAGGRGGSGGHGASSGSYHPMGDNHGLGSGLNLGSLLNRRQGFDRLGTEEGELESLSQDLSDAEYEATGETTELNT